MGELRLSGLSTGIDTESIIKQLMQVEQRRLNLYVQQQKEFTEKDEAVGELKTQLSSFKSNVHSLADASQLKSFATSSSNEDKLLAESSAAAIEGTHEVKIKQLASSERWVHDGYKRSTSYVGEGDFIFSYNNKEMVLSTTNTTTLEDLVGLINNDPDNPGVDASILKYDNGSDGVYHLVISGRESGSDYQITVNDSNTEKHISDAADPLTSSLTNEAAEIDEELTDLDGFSGVIESGSTADQIRISGTDHTGTPVEVYFDVTQYTTIEDLIDEINDAYSDTAVATYEEGQIILTDKTSGASSMTIDLDFIAGVGSSASQNLPTISQETQGGSITASIAALDPSTFLETQSAKNSLIRVDDYPGGSGVDETDNANWISRSSNTIDDVITGVTLKLQNITWDPDDVNTHDDKVDITLTRNTESLKTKLSSVVDDFNGLIQFFQDKASYDKEEEEAGVLYGEYSITTIISKIRAAFTGVATGFTGVDTFTLASDIGLEVGTDGRMTFDKTKFDEAIADDYLAVLELLGASKSGYSDSSVIKFRESSENITQAGEYDVEVTISGGQITSAKMKLASEGDSQWRDAVISDTNEAYGSMKTDSQNRYKYPEAALTFTTALGTADGTYTAKINVRQGFAGKVFEETKDMLDATDGTVTLVKDGFETRIKNYDDRIEEEQERLKTYEDNLVQKYARLEKNLALIQQQLGALNNL